MSGGILAHLALNSPQSGELAVRKSYSFAGSVGNFEMEYRRDREGWDLALTLASEHGLEGLCLVYEDGELRGGCNTVTKEGRMYPYVFALPKELLVLFPTIFSQSLADGEMTFLPHCLQIFLARQNYLRLQ